MAKKKLFWGILSLLLVYLILVQSNCPLPDEPTENYYSEQFFPYVRSDNAFTTYISLLNNGPSTMEAVITGYDQNGAQVFSETKMLYRYEIYRFSRSGFTGWVKILGRGSEHAVEAQLEMWGNDNSSLALEMPASTLPGLGYSWFYHLGVTDRGSGLERATIVTLNHIDQFPLYITFFPLSTTTPCASVEVLVSAYGLHVFNPLDFWQANFPQGIVDLPLAVEGNTETKASGNQVRNFSGALCQDLPGQDIALLNFRVLQGQYWNQWEMENAFFVDVRDDGLNRTDRIYLKDNSSSIYPPPSQDFVIHFYNNNGSEAAGSPKTVSLVHHFFSTASHTVISPQMLLGQAFSGSIWITQTGSSANIRFMETMVRRQSPGNWLDFVDDSPGKGPASPLDWQGVVPYVSSAIDSRRYSCTFFFPQSLYSVTGAPEIEADTYSHPGQDPPAPKNGVVVLSFRSETGQNKGWFAFRMQPNQTRTISINDLAQHLGSFTGSIRYAPMIPQLLEISDPQNKFHGTTSYQRDIEF